MSRNPLIKSQSNLLQRDNVRRRRQGRQSAGIKPQEMGQLVPPLLQCRLLGAQTLVHFLFSILKERVIHVHEYLVEYDRELTHAHKT